MNFTHKYAFTHIYGLTDPDDNRIRYIGQSVDPHARYKQHLNEIPRCPNQYRLSSKTHNLKMKWVGWLKLNGKVPGLVILEQCPLEDAAAREVFWIEMLLSEGNHLFNAMHGNGISLGWWNSRRIQWIIDEYNEFSELLLKTLDNN